MCGNSLPWPLNEQRRALKIPNFSPELRKFFCQPRACNLRMQLESPSRKTSGETRTSSSTAAFYFTTHRRCTARYTLMARALAIYVVPGILVKRHVTRLPIRFHTVPPFFLQRAQKCLCGLLIHGPVCHHDCSECLVNVLWHAASRPCDEDRRTWYTSRYGRVCALTTNLLLYTR